ncbi:MAG: hypothetical protein KAR18_13095, partial [Spirochaetes bacterium]|nr:hypothetical protein [Spirochaetota bacterium]
MAEEVKPAEKSVRDILYVLFKHKWKIIIIFVITMIVVTFILLSQPDMFESNAKILVGGGQASPVELVTGISGPSEINAEIELLRSRGFAEAVVDEMGPETVLYIPEDYSNPADMLFNLLEKVGFLKKTDEPDDPVKMREYAIENYMETLSLRIVPRSNIININYMARIPELAQEILTKTIEIYKDKHLEIHTTAVSMKFLTDETEKLKAGLKKSEEELRQFRNQIDIISLPEQQTFLLGSIGEIQSAIQETEANISGTEAAIEEVKAKI